MCTRAKTRSPSVLWPTATWFRESRDDRIAFQLSSMTSMTKRDWLIFYSSYWRLSSIVCSLFLLTSFPLPSFHLFLLFLLHLLFLLMSPNFSPCSSSLSFPHVTLILFRLLTRVLFVPCCVTIIQIMQCYKCQKLWTRLTTKSSVARARTHKHSRC